MVDLSTVIDGVLKTYASVLEVFLPYLWGTIAGNWYGSKNWKNYLVVAFHIAIVSLFLWATYGTHVEHPDNDPTGADAEVVEDFTPTPQQRNNHGLEILITWEIAALYGVYRRNKSGVGAEGSSDEVE
jgi:hypothetical protein